MGANCGSKDAAALLKESITDNNSVSIAAIGRAYFDRVIQNQLKVGWRARLMLDILGG